MQITEQGEQTEEVLDANMAFKTPQARLHIFVVISIFCLLFFGGMFGIEFNVYVSFLLIPMFWSMIWLSNTYRKARLAFWKTVAAKYGWIYLPKKDTSAEKGLIFDMGHSKKGYHSISGKHIEQPFELFEYQYTVGYGKNRTTSHFTIFEIKFSGTFPHLYLNYKGDWNTSVFFPSNIANISLPTQFTEVFKLYSPKEYEIETLQVFTPDVLQSLLNLGWDYDMEFVDGELIIYKSRVFSNFADLDTEVKRVRQIVELLAPQLNRMKLNKIGDFSSEL